MARTRSLLALFLSLTLVLGGCVRAPRAPRATQAPTTTTTSVKLAVEADGIYEVSAAALRSAGFDLAAATPQALTLSTGGEAVPFQLIGEGQSRALRFYGQARDLSAHTARNIYWLSAVPSLQDGGTSLGAPLPPSTSKDRLAAAALATASAAPSSAILTDVVSYTVHVEEQRQFVPKVDPGSDPWLWASLLAPGEIKVTATTPHLAAAAGPGPVLSPGAESGQVEAQVEQGAGQMASLKVRVWGNSSAPVDPDHHLLINLNGTVVADEKWDGLGEHVITATLSATLLHSGENQLVLQAPGDTGAAADSVLLDWAEITYPRRLIADGDEITFSGQADGFAVTLPGEVAALWDITYPVRSQIPESGGQGVRPVMLQDYATEGNTVRFAAGGAPRRYVAVTQAGFHRPAAIAAVPASYLATAGPGDLYDWPGGADMIVITAPQFRDALGPLIEARRAEGLRVAVTDIETVYDAFNYGRAEPAAIQSLIRHAVAHWTAPAPRFLLLAGDASYDPRGYLKGPEVDLVPTMLVDTEFGGWTASDVWYALGNDSPTALPVLAVGRFPAQTAEQMAAMVAKTVTYEHGDATAPWRTRALFVADNDEPAFGEEAKHLLEALPVLTGEEITIGDDSSTARTALLRAFEDGTGWIGYFGHGSVTLWAQEKIFSVDDVPKLTNREKWPVVFTFTCLTGFFHHPLTPSLGEVLLRARDAGAVAALVPSSAGLLADHQLLGQGLAAALSPTDGNQPAKTLGEAILAAQRSLPEPTGGLRNTLLTFNLLGDPALNLGLHLP